MKEKQRKVEETKEGRKEGPAEERQRRRQDEIGFSQCLNG